MPSPVYQAMEQGSIVRFEEITRCPPEIQDTLVSVLSEKQLMVPELGDGFRVSAAQGFNVIATANLRDRGVHEMSSALKRASTSRRSAPSQTAPSRPISLLVPWTPSSVSSGCP